MLLDEIGRHIMRESNLAALTATNVTRLAGGLGALDHSPSPVLFDALAERAASIGSKGFTPEQRSELAAAYRQLGYESKLPFQE